MAICDEWLQLLFDEPWELLSCLADARSLRRGMQAARPR